ncbi:MAG: hypothetical protein EOO01_30930 [Chitinophagaceae bacterium]|nr:MAG: hypothetical protein EOO01_30930 [Chitinophagaceae bacterium]
MQEEIVGIAAGIGTSVSLLPQLIKLIKEKKAENISLLTFFVLLIGLGGWIAYGVMKDDKPIIFTNCFSFIVNSLIIFFSIKYKEKLA